MRNAQRDTKWTTTNERTKGKRQFYNSTKETPKECIYRSAPVHLSSPLSGKAKQELLQPSIPTTGKTFSYFKSAFQPPNQRPHDENYPTFGKIEPRRFLINTGTPTTDPLSLLGSLELRSSVVSVLLRVKSETEDMSSSTFTLIFENGV